MRHETYKMHYACVQYVQYVVYCLVSIMVSRSPFTIWRCRTKHWIDHGVCVCACACVRVCSSVRMCVCLGFVFAWWVYRTFVRGAHRWTALPFLVTLLSLPLSSSISFSLLLVLSISSSRPSLSPFLLRTPHPPYVSFVPSSPPPSVFHSRSVWGVVWWPGSHPASGQAG